MTDQLFFKTNMPASRQADYYLGYLNGCVFIDFNNIDNESICLKRISFNGYGCYELGDQAISMNIDDSRKFKTIYEDNLADQVTLMTIVKKAITLNKQDISADALKEYGLF